MDPFQAPIAGLPQITRDTSAQDAEILRKRLNDAFDLLPPDTLLGDKARREEFGHALRSVTAVTAVFIVASELLPGTVGQLVAGLLAAAACNRNRRSECRLPHRSDR